LVAADAVAIIAKINAKRVLRIIALVSAEHGSFVVSEGLVRNRHGDALVQICM
jgi:hypothetical protein